MPREEHSIINHRVHIATRIFYNNGTANRTSVISPYSMSEGHEHKTTALDLETTVEKLQAQ